MAAKSKKTIPTTKNQALTQKVGKYIVKDGLSCYVAWADETIAVAIGHENFKEMVTYVFVNPAYGDQREEELPWDVLEPPSYYYNKNMTSWITVLRPNKIDEIKQAMNNLPEVFKYKESDYTPQISADGQELIIPECEYTIKEHVLDGDELKWIRVGHTGYNPTKVKIRDALKYGHHHSSNYTHWQQSNPRYTINYFLSKESGRWVLLDEYSKAARDIINSYVVGQKLIDSLHH